jgi:hypothetical protein
MLRVSSLTILCLSLAACANNVPSSPESLPTVADSPTAGTEPTVQDENAPSGVQEIITVAEIPDAPKAERTVEKQEVICERVRRTGTHRATRICRTRAEIERESLDGKDTFDELHRAQRAQREY